MREIPALIGRYWRQLNLTRQLPTINWWRQLILLNVMLAAIAMLVLTTQGAAAALPIRLIGSAILLLLLVEMLDQFPRWVTGGLLVLAGALAGGLGVVQLYGMEATWQQIIADFYASISTQLLSVALIITVIERLAHLRGRRVTQLTQVVNRLSADHQTAIRTLQDQTVMAWLRAGHLHDRSFNKVDWKGARLARVRLERADLRRADLTGVTLTEANLRGALLNGARCVGADLRGADLRGASLRRVDLRYARLDGAWLDAADLRGADISDEQLLVCHTARDILL